MMLKKINTLDVIYLYSTKFKMRIYFIIKSINDCYFIILNFLILNFSDYIMFLKNENTLKRMSRNTIVSLDKHDLRGVIDTWENVHKKLIEIKR